MRQGRWKRWARRSAALVLALVAVLAVAVAPIDYTSLHDQPFYRHTMNRLDTFRLCRHAAMRPLRAAWSRFSIVPDHPVRMAGYGIRKKFETVIDSLYIRIFTLDNGAVTVHFVTADLLIFPPVLKRQVLHKLGLSKKGFVFFGATHTHSGVGGWDPSIAGSVLLGAYRSEWMEDIAQRIVDRIKAAPARLKEATLYNWQADGGDYIKNRIFNTFDKADGQMRGIAVQRSDSSRALLCTYGAHPSSLPKENTALSNDYISDLMSTLGGRYDFVQFMGGMMASHTLARLPRPDYTAYIGRQLGQKILQATLVPLPDYLLIQTGRVEITLGPSQFRIAKNWRLRDWLFRSIMRPLRGELTLLQLDSLLFMGVPCDFSGELYLINRYDSLAAHYGKKLIITGFNGEYTGYITADYLYLQEYRNNEVQTLNWVGPYFGQYYDEMIRRILLHTSDSLPAHLSLRLR